MKSSVERTLCFICKILWSLSFHNIIEILLKGPIKDNILKQIELHIWLILTVRSWLWDVQFYTYDLEMNKTTFNFVISHINVECN